jgi:hypothetical protein
MDLNPRDLATLVLGILARAAPGTVVTVRAHGAVETEPPGSHAPAYERREPLVATFVATQRPISAFQVLARIQQGLGKFENRVGHDAASSLQS